MNDKKTHWFQDKQNVYTCNKIKFNHKKEYEWILKTCLVTHRCKWTNTVWFYFYKGSQIGKLMETESGIVVTTGWGRGTVGTVVMSTEILFGMMNTFWRWTVVMVAQDCEWPNAAELCLNIVNFLLCVLYHNKEFWKIVSNAGRV